MIVNLPFGCERFPIDLRGLRVKALSPAAPSGSLDIKSLVMDALKTPLDGLSLEEMARGRQSVAVIVPDSTRRAALPVVLPVILRILERAGIHNHGITILVACGTHPQAGREATAEFLGPLPPGIHVLEHDSRDPDALVTVGTLRPGVPLRLHRAAVESELLVTVGTVRHHYFAGFGGGPKMIFPGVGGYEEIQENHALVLQVSQYPPQRNPNCEPGVLKGNPVAEEIAFAAEFRPPDCSLCLVEGSEGRIVWAGSGSWKVAFEAAVQRVREWYEVPLGQRFDLMVACGGGAPADATLIQAHKGLDAASRFLEPGGELLFLSSLADGAGSPEMLPFLRDPRAEAILSSLAEQWVQYGHTTLRILEKTERFRIKLYSHLEPEFVSSLGFEPAPNPDVVMESWRQKHPGTTVGVMASGVVYPFSS